MTDCAWFCTEPTNPPPPPMTNFRFHSSGISSENLISVPITPATRQCASLIPAALAGTATASVILTSGRLNCVNWAQSPCSAAARAGANDTEPAARRAARIDVFMPRMIRQRTDRGHGKGGGGGHGNEEEPPRARRPPRQRRDGLDPWITLAGAFKKTGA